MSLLNLKAIFGPTTDACPAWCPCTNEIESDEYDRYPEFFDLIGVGDPDACEETGAQASGPSPTQAASRASSVSDRSTP